MSWYVRQVMDKTVPTPRLGRPVKEFLVEVRAGADAPREARSEGTPLTVGTAADNHLVLRDASVSRYHLEIERDDGHVVVRDLGTTNDTRIGSVWLSKAEVRLELPTEVQIGETTLMISEGGFKLTATPPKTRLGLLVSSSPSMFPVLEEMEQVAASNVPVLLLGESGSGKELFAQTIHETSPRSANTFVTVDCAALTPQLFMSELFGHEKGAFTGARERRRGAFERADGGTIFLDELGELPADQQTALLGVLERKRFKRVGGDAEIEVDVRVVAATNRDLRAEVNAGRFRLDLYYRLAVVLLRIPPLRKRIQDLESLAARFLLEEGFTGDISAVFTDEQLATMRGHSWPGNVRELRNVVLASLATGRGPRLEAADDESRQDGESVLIFDFDKKTPSYRDARQQLTQAFEKSYLEALMKKESSIRSAARLAQMDRGYLTDLLRRHGLK